MSNLAVEWVAAEDLFENPANPRRNDATVPHVEASLRRFGWQQPLVVKESGEVIVGHTRLKAARSLGMEQVPVVRFECDGTFATLVNDGRLIPFGLDAGSGNSAWYQYWYRDPANGAGSLGTALSNAVQLDFQ